MLEEEVPPCLVGAKLKAQLKLNCMILTDFTEWGCPASIGTLSFSIFYTKLILSNFKTVFIFHSRKKKSLTLLGGTSAMNSTIVTGNVLYWTSTLPSRRKDSLGRADLYYWSVGHMAPASSCEPHAAGSHPPGSHPPGHTEMATSPVLGCGGGDFWYCIPLSSNLSVWWCMYPSRADQDLGVPHYVAKRTFARSSLVSVVGRIMAPKDVHTLILRTCEYVSFHGERGFYR